MKQAFWVLIFALIVSGHLSAKETNNIQVEVLAKDTRSWDGKTLPNYPSGNPEITILKITIQPNVELPWHKHPLINAGVLLKGELTVVTIDNQRLYLKAGDTIIELVDTWHHGITESMRVANQQKLLCFMLAHKKHLYR